MTEFSIEGRKIGRNFPPYVIAELSGNHNGSLETACKLIDAARMAGADAIKIQTYTPDTITLRSDLPDFRIDGGLWDGKTLYELYEWAHTPWEWHKTLFDYARSVGITLFSSPFDSSAVDLLENLNVPAYKIASFEAVDLPLIRYVAGTGKPMIISTGMVGVSEIEEAVEAALSSGCEQLAILHCVSGYPAPAEDYNLHTIPDMIDRFGLVTGLSDHTLDRATAIAAVALGASIIEKHFTLDRHGGGPDDSFSIEPDELASLCNGARTAWSALGLVDYGLKSSERGNVKFKRSLYFVRDVAKGQRIGPGDIRSVRPGYGMPPKMLPKLLGKKLARNVAANTPVSADCIAD